MSACEVQTPDWRGCVIGSGRGGWRPVVLETEPGWGMPVRQISMFPSELYSMSPFLFISLERASMSRTQVCVHGALAYITNLSLM